MNADEYVADLCRRLRLEGTALDNEAAQALEFERSRSRAMRNLLQYARANDLLPGPRGGPQAGPRAAPVASPHV